MLAHWMTYCVVVGVLLSSGAVALEKALRPLGRGTRWVWAASLLLTLAVPAVVRFAGPRQAAAPVAMRAAAFAPSADEGTAPARRALPWWRDAVDAIAAVDAQRLEAPLAVLWGASSASVVLALGAMAFALRRRRGGWTARTIDGVPVLVSADTGPAVVGLVHSRIVLPSWAVEAGGDARALVLEHEQEHVRAGDPRLLAGALASAALMPWNPAVWWQLRRLRLAVEVDCDARVLRRRADVHAYGSVLLEVGRRASHTPLAAAAAFAEPVSTLERRIRIMTAPRVRRPVLRAAGFGALALALVAVACEAPAPLQPSPGGTRQAYAAPGADSRPRSPMSPRSLLQEYFPNVLRRGMADGDVIVFVLNADGMVIDHSLLNPSRSGEGSGVASQGAGVARALDRYRTQLASMNVIKSKPGELGPTEVRIAIAQLKATPADGGGHGSADARGSELEQVTDRALVASPADQHPGEMADRVLEAERVAYRAAVARHYPEAARRTGTTGRVAVRLFVDDQGKGRNLEIVRSTDPAFVDAARAVVNDLTFSDRGEMVMVIDFSPERTPAPAAR